MNFKDLYDIWSKDSFFDASTQKELADIANDEKEIEEIPQSRARSDQRTSESTLVGASDFDALDSIFEPV